MMGFDKYRKKSKNFLKFKIIGNISPEMQSQGRCFSWERKSGSVMGENHNRITITKVKVSMKLINTDATSATGTFSQVMKLRSTLHSLSC